MNFAAFDFRSLQNCRAILAVMSGGGVTNISAASALLDQLILKESMDTGMVYGPAVKSSVEACPHCGLQLQRCNITGDVYCRKCRYSRLGADK